MRHCPTAQMHDAKHAGTLARREPVADDHHTRACHTRCSIDALRLRTRARWAAHATWHSAARPSAPAHGESLPHGSNARTPHACSLARCGPVANDHHAGLVCHSMLDRCTETAHERDGLLTLHGTRQHVPGRLPTVSHCPTAQTHDATRVQPCSLWACCRRPHHASLPHSMLDRCTETAQESTMGCSRYMALGSTCQGACLR